MPPDFDKQSYWHERFTSEEAFEWLVSSDSFAEILEPYLRELGRSARILQLGFGTSDLQNHLRRRGFEDVTNVDYEPLAVDRGTRLEERAFGDVRMKYAVADATQLDPQDLPAPDSATPFFDLVVDKSAVDAVSCAGGTALFRMARGVKRCLASGGKWISLSFSAQRFSADPVAAAAARQGEPGVPEDGTVPFDVEVISKIPTPKWKETDPDIYYWVYLLRPKPD